MAASDSTISQRQCTVCGESFPSTVEYFHRDKHGKDGLRADCKICNRASRRQYRNDNLEVRRQKELEYNAAHREQRAEYARQWREDNPTYDREYRKPRKAIKNSNQRAWRARNPEKVKVYRRTDRERHAVNIRLRNKRWAERNVERSRELSRKSYRRNRASILEKNRAYRLANPEKIRAKSHKRRIQLQQAHGHHTGADIKLQYQSQRGKCWWCGVKVDSDYHVDHRIPISRGGSNGPGNIVISCPACNLSKSNKLPSEWKGRLL